MWPFSKTKRQSEMHAVDALRAGRADIDVFQAAYAGWSNDHALNPYALQALYGLVLAAKRPVLDVGSGLSTIIMAVAAEKAGVPVHALEVDQDHWNKTTATLTQLRLKATVHKCDLERGWYALPDDFPAHFGLVLIDGPQHSAKDRAHVYDRIGDRMTDAVVMADDLIHDEVARPFNAWVVKNRHTTKRFGRFAYSQRWGA